jgi:hypothetical protein
MISPVSPVASLHKPLEAAMGGAMRLDPLEVCGVLDGIMGGAFGGAQGLYDLLVR